jgi:dihydrofolate reductase
MGRLIVQEFVTLDGRAAGPEGETDFIPAATEGDSVVADNQMQFLDTIDTIVLGRRTYEMFAGYWPTATGDIEPFANKLNAIPKLVFSKTLEHAPWGEWDEATLSDDPREEIRRRRDGGGKDMVVWGSLTLVESLAEAGLVDEYQLWLLPVVLGGGRPLFAGDTGSFTMRLLEARTSDKGSTLLRYEPQ